MKVSRYQNIIFLLVAVSFFHGVKSKPVVAEDPKTFRFANIYGDHMVLQKAPNHAIVWGFGEVDQQVNVELSGKEYTTKVTSGINKRLIA